MTYPIPHFDVWRSRRGFTRVHIAIDTNKRESIRTARRCARTKYSGQYPRQVSVYAHSKGKRPTLLYQVHYSPKLRRLIAEEL